LPTQKKRKFDEMKGAASTSGDDIEEVLEAGKYQPAAVQRNGKTATKNMVVLELE
jgi:hypothetical protein